MQMADIARLAGVSASTVSRALSGSPLIPEATRNRITELATSLNYRVNVGAANLRRKDVHTVGVIILGDSMQSISDPFLLSILGTVADTLDERGMSLLLSRLKEGQPHQLPAFVESGQVAGLIVIGQLTWHDHLNRLATQRMPMAVWGACLADAMYPVVGGDNEQGGYLATRHLVERGCRHIAFFGDTTHPEAGLRHQGYLRALSEAASLKTRVCSSRFFLATCASARPSTSGSPSTCISIRSLPAATSPPFPSWAHSRSAASMCRARSGSWATTTSPCRSTCTPR